MSLLMPLDGVGEGESALASEIPAPTRCKGSSTTLNTENNSENNVTDHDDNITQDTQVAHPDRIHTLHMAVSWLYQCFVYDPKF